MNILQSLTKHVKLSSDEKKVLKQKTEATKISDKVFKEEKARVFGVEPDDILPPLTSFADLVSAKKISESFLSLLKSSGVEEPSPIQRAVIPYMLEGTRDVMAVAPTGSGKTLAFLLPLFSMLKKHEKNGGFRACILVPTRELALQLERECFNVSGHFRVCILGQDILAGFKAQKKAAEEKNSESSEHVYPQHSFDILVATPLTLVSALENKLIDFSNLQALILDEADRLLEDNFLEQTDAILAACPTERRVFKALFTATLSSGIEALAVTFLKDPLRIVIGEQNAAVSTIEQQLVFVGQEEGKWIAVRQIIQKGIKPPVLLFCDSIERANMLYERISQEKIPCAVIHSDKSSHERAEIVKQFRIGKVWLLITTELLARGIDFKGVQCVINYDFPRTCASYIHRIGRTGRAGRQGHAITLYTLEDADYLRSIANVMKASGCDVPAHLLAMKKVKNREKRKRPVEEKKKKPFPMLINKNPKIN